MAAQGIGLATARAFAHEGARVIAIGINAEILYRLALSVPDTRTAVLDVHSSDAIAALAAELPPLDDLFGCAGFVHNGSVLACDEAEWDFSIYLEVRSMYRMVRAFLPGMLRKACHHGGGASVVNMALAASSVKGFPNGFVYGASKATVIGMTKSIAADYVERGLRCNAPLYPGTAKTPSLRQRIASSADPVQAEKDFIAPQPMGWLAKVDDIAPQVVYLLSDESRFVTGQVVLVICGAKIS